ncbi:GYDIA family GHMP kinase [Pricia sp.]|uniref:GYDIA family GHMP kinase n=1 Tax=Pricia sp. TaxID=2268138 RepID=UPI003593BEA6
MAKEFYSNGKLLLTGEYAVLDGALSLAVPTKYGQSLSLKEVASNTLQWKSYDENGAIWFEGTFDLSPPENTPKEQSAFSPDTGHITLGFNDHAHHQSREKRAIAVTLLKILREAHTLNPYFLGDKKGYAVETKMTFARDWGLGSSSTLINNIAQWAEVDAYELLWNVFSGSGYDIACAQYKSPILYRRKKNRPYTQKRGTPSLPIAEVEEVNFNPPFRDKLYFIHLNKKQNSREGIAAYRKKDFDNAKLARQVSEITRETVSCKSLSEFESLMTQHETLLSQTLQMPTVKELLFPDFTGIVKSLGAWGGDFVLATGDGTTPMYFEGLGYETVLPYPEMVLEPAG